VNVLDLFSGIGGFSLGLERAGMRTVAFCEIDSYCCAVLRKHWPDVPQYDDIRELTGERLCADGIFPDVICGGFPCQDISVAGKGAGLAGERSGLWSEYARLIGEIRPQYVIVENVAALLGRGLGRVLGDLAALGYDAEWHCISASEVGAPHRRDRVWIIATDAGSRRRQVGPTPSTGRRQQRTKDAVSTTPDDNAVRKLQQDWSVTYLGGRPLHSVAGYWSENWDQKLSALCSVDDGVSRSMDGLAAALFGNAVLPQIPEIIGRAIMQAEGLSA